jgi:membrane protease YdiL (CAAX protease family)
VTVTGAAAQPVVSALAGVPDPPELPEAARPRWPAWYGPAALGSSFAGLLFVFVGFFASLTPVLPVLPVLLGAGESDNQVQGVGLLVGIFLQDLLLVGSAYLFASMRLSPRAWHFGVRSTRRWRTIGLAALTFAALMGFELAYLALVGTDASNDDLGAGNGVLSALAVGTAVIVIAPVTEELFFRGFFYRALRSRMRIGWAALIDGLVFASLHFQGVGTALEIIPVIAVFGIGQCLLYERTGSIFAVIAVHAAFNTVASLGHEPGVALVIGALVITTCVLAPRLVGPGPSPFGANPRARPAPAPA